MIVRQAIPDVRPTLDYQQERWLFAAALRSPAVFQAVRDHLPPNTLCMPGESGMELLWRLAVDLVGRFSLDLRDGDSFRDVLKAHFLSATKVDADLTPVEGVADIVEVFLPWAFSIPANEVNEPHALDLLQQFLLERTIHLPLQEFLRNCSHGCVMLAPALVLTDLAQRATAITAIGSVPARSLQGDWEEYQRRLQIYRGREMIGLQTGFRQLDENTLGLRGLFVLGAAPGVGKTALAIQLGLGAANPENNDAVFVFVSLEMDRWALYDRIFCSIAGVDWKTLRLGSQSLRRNPVGPHLTPEHQGMLGRAEEVLNGGLGARVRVYDRETLGSVINAPSIISRIEAAKREVGATRAFVVLDYLQLLPVPEEVTRQGDLESDKYRVRLVQDIVAAMKTAANPGGDPLVVISETRKPSGGSRAGWGRNMSELMGSARLAYGADAALVYHVMDDKEIETQYPEAVGGGEAYRLELEERGISPVMLTLAKGRDGMTRTSWGIEFRFRESRFRELPRRTTRPGGMVAPPTPATPPPPAPRPAMRAPGSIGYVPNRTSTEPESRA